MTQIQTTICAICHLNFLNVPFATRILMNDCETYLDNYNMKCAECEKNINAT